MVQIQQQAPNFVATAVMPDGSFNKEFSLANYRGKYVVLFFYPLDFTFVCPTEIIAFSDRVEEFRSRNAEVIGVSVDSEFSHLAWRNTPRSAGGIGEVTYPLVADLDKSIARDYGVLLEKPAVALRGLFLIDREGIARSMIVNDLSLGRSVDEVLRLLDALRHVEQYGEVCPADWTPGAEAMQASNEGLQTYAGKAYA